jgi:hypothetical protein
MGSIGIGELLIIGVVLIVLIAVPVAVVLAILASQKKK